MYFPYSNKKLYSLKGNINIQLNETMYFEDIYNEGNIYHFYSIQKKIKRGTFFSTKRNLDFNFRYNDNNLTKRFYKYFSKTKWGQHFISGNLLQKDVTAIENNSGVIIHHITDIDSNGHFELWITYKLKYGEIGAMVYENENNTWNEISNKCINCD
jgi:hypothetical protein